MNSSKMNPILTFDSFKNKQLTHLLGSVAQNIHDKLKPGLSLALLTLLMI